MNEPHGVYGLLACCGGVMHRHSEADWRIVSIMSQNTPKSPRYVALTVTF